MATETLPDLIEKNMQEILRQVALEILARKLPGYSSLSVEQLIKFFTPIMQTAVRYLRNGDVNEWREYLAQTSKNLRSQGYSIDAVNATSIIVGAKTIEMIERKLPGPANEEVKLRYISRVNSLRTIANTNILKVHIEKGQ